MSIKQVADRLFRNLRSAEYINKSYANPARWHLYSFSSPSSEARFWQFRGLALLTQSLFRKGIALGGHKSWVRALAPDGIIFINPVRTGTGEITGKDVKPSALRSLFLNGVRLRILAGAGYFER